MDEVFSVQLKVNADELQDSIKGISSAINNEIKSTNLLANSSNAQNAGYDLDAARAFGTVAQANLDQISTQFDLMASSMAKSLQQAQSLMSIAFSDLQGQMTAVKKIVNSKDVNAGVQKLARSSQRQQDRNMFNARTAYMRADMQDIKWMTQALKKNSNNSQFGVGNTKAMGIMKGSGSIVNKLLGDVTHGKLSTMNDAQLTELLMQSKAFRSYVDSYSKSGKPIDEKYVRNLARGSVLAHVPQYQRKGRNQAIARYSGIGHDYQAADFRTQLPQFYRNIGPVEDEAAEKIFKRTSKQYQNSQVAKSAYSVIKQLVARGNEQARMHAIQSGFLGRNENGQWAWQSADKIDSRQISDFLSRTGKSYRSAKQSKNLPMFKKNITSGEDNKRLTNAQNGVIRDERAIMQAMADQRTIQLAASGVNKEQVDDIYTPSQYTGKINKVFSDKLPDSTVDKYGKVRRKKMFQVQRPHLATDSGNRVSSTVNTTDINSYIKNNGVQQKQADPYIALQQSVLSRMLGIKPGEQDTYERLKMIPSRDLLLHTPGGSIYRQKDSKGRQTNKPIYKTGAQQTVNDLFSGNTTINGTNMRAFGFDKDNNILMANADSDLFINPDASMSVDEYKRARAIKLLRQGGSQANYLAMDTKTQRKIDENVRRLSSPSVALDDPSIGLNANPDAALINFSAMLEAGGLTDGTNGTKKQIFDGAAIFDSSVLDKDAQMRGAFSKFYANRMDIQKSIQDLTYGSPFDDRKHFYMANINAGKDQILALQKILGKNPGEGTTPVKEALKGYYGQLSGFGSMTDKQVFDTFISDYFYDLKDQNGPKVLLSDTALKDVGIQNKIKTHNGNMISAQSGMRSMSVQDYEKIFGTQGDYQRRIFNAKDQNGQDVARVRLNTNELTQNYGDINKQHGFVVMNTSQNGMYTGDIIGGSMVRAIGATSSMRQKSAQNFAQLQRSIMTNAGIIDRFKDSDNEIGRYIRQNPDIAAGTDDLLVSMANTYVNGVASQIAEGGLYIPGVMKSRISGITPYDAFNKAGRVFNQNAADTQEDPLGKIRTMTLFRNKQDQQAYDKLEQNKRDEYLKTLNPNDYETVQAAEYYAGKAGAGDLQFASRFPAYRDQDVFLAKKDLTDYIKKYSLDPDTARIKPETMDLLNTGDFDFDTIWNLDRRAFTDDQYLDFVKDTIRVNQRLQAAKQSMGVPDEDAESSLGAKSWFGAFESHVNGSTLAHDLMGQTTKGARDFDQLSPLERTSAAYKALAEYGMVYDLATVLSKKGLDFEGFSSNAAAQLRLGGTSDRVFKTLNQQDLTDQYLKQFDISKYNPASIFDDTTMGSLMALAYARQQNGLQQNNRFAKNIDRYVALFNDGSARGRLIAGYADLFKQDYTGNARVLNSDQFAKKSVSLRNLLQQARKESALKQRTNDQVLQDQRFFKGIERGLGAYSSRGMSEQNLALRKSMSENSVAQAQLGTSGLRSFDAITQMIQGAGKDEYSLAAIAKANFEQAQQRIQRQIIAKEYAKRGNASQQQLQRRIMHAQNSGNRSFGWSSVSPFIGKTLQTKGTLASTRNDQNEYIGLQTAMATDITQDYGDKKHQKYMMDQIMKETGLIDYEDTIGFETVLGSAMHAAMQLMQKDVQNGHTELTDTAKQSYQKAMLDVFNSSSYSGAMEKMGLKVTKDNLGNLQLASTNENGTISKEYSQSFSRVIAGLNPTMKFLADQKASGNTLDMMQGKIWNGKEFVSVNQKGKDGILAPLGSTIGIPQFTFTPDRIDVSGTGSDRSYRMMDWKSSLSGSNSAVFQQYAYRGWLNELAQKDLMEQMKDKDLEGKDIFDLGADYQGVGRYGIMRRNKQTKEWQYESLLKNIASYNPKTGQLLETEANEKDQGNVSSTMIDTQKMKYFKQQRGYSDQLMNKIIEDKKEESKNSGGSQGDISAFFAMQRFGQDSQTVNRIRSEFYKDKYRRNPTNNFGRNQYTRWLSDLQNTMDPSQLVRLRQYMRDGALGTQVGQDVKNRVQQVARLRQMIINQGRISATNGLDEAISRGNNIDNKSKGLQSIGTINSILAGYQNALQGLSIYKADQTIYDAKQGFLTTQQKRASAYIEKNPGQQAPTPNAALIKAAQDTEKIYNEQKQSILQHMGVGSDMDKQIASVIENQTKQLNAGNDKFLAQFGKENGINKIQQIYQKRNQAIQQYVQQQDRYIDDIVKQLKATMQIDGQEVLKHAQGSQSRKQLEAQLASVQQHKKEASQVDLKKLSAQDLENLSADLSQRVNALQYSPKSFLSKNGMATLNTMQQDANTLINGLSWGVSVPQASTAIDAINNARQNLISQYVQQSRQQVSVGYNPLYNTSNAHFVANKQDAYSASIVKTAQQQLDHAKQIREQAKKEKYNNNEDQRKKLNDQAQQIENNAKAMLNPSYIQHGRQIVGKMATQQYAHNLNMFDARIANTLYGTQMGTTQKYADMQFNALADMRKKVSDMNSDAISEQQRTAIKAELFGTGSNAAEAQRALMNGATVQQLKSIGAGGLLGYTVNGGAQNLEGRLQRERQLQSQHQLLYNNTMAKSAQRQLATSNLNSALRTSGLQNTFIGRALSMSDQFRNQYASQRDTATQRMIDAQSMLEQRRNALAAYDVKNNGKDSQQRRRLAKQQEQAQNNLALWKKNQANAQRGMDSWSGVSGAAKGMMSQISSMLVSSLQNMMKGIINTVKQFTIQYDNAMASIKMVNKDANIEKVGQNILKSAKNMKVSFGQVAQTALQLYRQGLSDDQVDQRMETVTKFSKVANISGTDANKLVATALNTGLWNSASQVTDVIANLGDNAATNAGQITKVIKKAGAGAAANGVSGNQLAAMATLATSKTQLSGNIIGTSLNSIISRVAKIGTNELTYDQNNNAVSGSALAKLLSLNGVQVYDQNGQVNTFNILKQIGQNWDTYSDATQAQIATAVAGTRGYSNFAALMQGFGQTDQNGVSMMDKLLGLTQNSQGSVDTKYEAYLATLQASITGVKDSFEQLIQTLVDTGVLTGFLDWVQNVIQGMNQLAKSGNLITSVIPAILSLTVAFAGLQAALHGNWAAGLTIAAIGGIGAAIGVSAFNSIGKNANAHNENVSNQIEKTNKTYQDNSALIDYNKNVLDKVQKGQITTQQQRKEFIKNQVILDNEFNTNFASSFANAANSVQSFANSLDGYSSTIDEYSKQNKQRVLQAAREDYVLAHSNNLRYNQRDVRGDINGSSAFYDFFAKQIYGNTDVDDKKRGLTIPILTTNDGRLDQTTYGHVTSELNSYYEKYGGPQEYNEQRKYAFAQLNPFVYAFKDAVSKGADIFDQLLAGKDISSMNDQEIAKNYIAPMLTDYIVGKNQYSEELRVLMEYARLAIDTESDSYGFTPDQNVKKAIQSYVDYSIGQDVQNRQSFVNAAAQAAIRQYTQSKGQFDIQSFVNNLSDNVWLQNQQWYKSYKNNEDKTTTSAVGNKSLSAIQAGAADYENKNASMFAAQSVYSQLMQITGANIDVDSFVKFLQAVGKDQVKNFAALMAAVPQLAQQFKSLTDIDWNSDDPIAQLTSKISQFDINHIMQLLIANTQAKDAGYITRQKAVQGTWDQLRGYVPWRSETTVSGGGSSSGAGFSGGIVVNVNSGSSGNDNSGLSLQEEQWWNDQDWQQLQLFDDDSFAPVDDEGHMVDGIPFVNGQQSWPEIDDSWYDYMTGQIDQLPYYVDKQGLYYRQPKKNVQNKSDEYIPDKNVVNPQQQWAGYNVYKDMGLQYEPPGERIHKQETHQQEIKQSAMDSVVDFLLGSFEHIYQNIQSNRRDYVDNAEGNAVIDNYLNQVLDRDKSIQTLNQLKQQQNRYYDQIAQEKKQQFDIEEKNRRDSILQPQIDKSGIYYRQPKTQIPKYEPQKQTTQQEQTVTDYQSPIMEVPQQTTSMQWSQMSKQAQDTIRNILKDQPDLLSEYINKGYTGLTQEQQKLIDNLSIRYSVGASGYSNIEKSRGINKYYDALSTGDFQSVSGFTQNQQSQYLSAIPGMQNAYVTAYGLNMYGDNTATLGNMSDWYGKQGYQNQTGLINTMYGDLQNAKQMFKQLGNAVKRYGYSAMNQFSDSEKQVTSQMQLLTGGTKKYVQAMQNYNKATKSAGDANYYLKKFRGGDRSKQTNQFMAQATGIDIKQLQKMKPDSQQAKRAIQIAEKYAEGLYETVNSDIQASFNSFGDLGQMQISPQMDIALNGDGVTVSGSANIAQLLGNAIDQETISAILQAQSKGLTVTAQITKANGVVQIQWTTSGGPGGSYTPSGGGGGGGGKSKADKLITQRQHVDKIYEHQIKMVQADQQYYQTTGDLTAYGTMVEKEIQLQENRKPAIKQNIKLLMDQLKQTKKNSDDWYKLRDKVMQYEQQLEQLDKTIVQNTKKLAQNRVAIMDTKATLQEAIKTTQQQIRDTAKQRLSATVDMSNTILDIVKNRYEQEWQMVQKDIQKKKEALQDEKSLIDERVNARKDAQDQMQKYNKLAQYQRQLTLIQTDPTRNKDIRELQNNISELRKQLGWDITEKQTQAQKNTIDSIINSLDQYVEQGSEDLQHLLQNANNFSDQVNGVLQMNHSQLIAWMQENNKQYINSLKDACKQMVDTFTESYATIRGLTMFQGKLYNTSDESEGGQRQQYWNAVNEKLGTRDKYLEYKKGTTQYQNASDEQRQRLLYDWGEQYDTYAKAYQYQGDKIFSTDNIDKLLANKGNKQGYLNSVGVRQGTEQYDRYDKLFDDYWHEQMFDESTGTTTSSSKGGTTAKKTQQEAKYRYKLPIQIYGSSTEDGKASRVYYGWAKGQYKETELLARQSAINAALSQLKILYAQYRERLYKVNGQYDINNITAYKNGGLVDFTGPAWVDGTKSKPEAFISSDDRQLMRSFLDSVKYVSIPDFSTRIDTSNMGNTQNIGDVYVTINEAELNSEQDIESIAYRIGQKFVSQISRSGMRLQSYNF